MNLRVNVKLIHEITRKKLSFGNKSIDRLNSDTLNTLRVRFMYSEHLIIDEISFVGGNFFDQVNMRLQEVMGNNEAFGGLNVFAVGDMD